MQQGGQGRIEEAICCTVNCSPRRTIARRSKRFKEKTTPALARAGVPIRLWNPIPRRMEMIMG
jgi:hypothetical protein